MVTYVQNVGYTVLSVFHHLIQLVVVTRHSYQLMSCLNWMTQLKLILTQLTLKWTCTVPLVPVDSTSTRRHLLCV